MAGVFVIPLKIGLILTNKFYDFKITDVNNGGVLVERKVAP
jgi:hypothetical protein